MKTVIMRATLNHLRRVYLWPKTETSSNTTPYWCLVSGSFLLIGSILYLVVSTHNNENANIVEAVETITSQIGVMYFASFFISNQKSITEIVSDLSDFEKFGKPPHFDVRNKELDRYARTFGIILYTASIGVFLWPAIYTQGCDDVSGQICGFVSPIWLPFDFHYFPTKQLVYAWQCYCCLVTYGAGGMFSFAMLETMEHLIVKIQHLKILIRDVIENPRKRQTRLAKCVDYHIYIFSIAKKMNDSYRVSLSVHVLCAGVLFGFIGHTVMDNAFTINSISLFVGWFASLFVVCVGGQNLMDESLSVGTAVYNTGWYKLDVKFQKNVIPIIVRSQRPILIHAGPFTFLSLLLILAVLQTAYTYVNLLNATS